MEENDPAPLSTLRPFRPWRLTGLPGPEGNIQGAKLAPAPRLEVRQLHDVGRAVPVEHFAVEIVARHPRRSAGLRGRAEAGERSARLQRDVVHSPRIVRTHRVPIAHADGA